MKRKALGKGISALILERESDTKDKIIEIELHQISPNKYQPRRIFNEDDIRELASSITAKGVIQPIIVRKAANGGYELIAGERRWRASQIAGLKKIPAMVKNVTDEETLELALIENIQRKQLNPIEEAKAYKILLDEFNLLQEDVAKQVGKDRSTVTNYLRLLSLPVEIQNEISNNNISTGHAKVLLSLENPEDQISVGRMILKESLSVRKVETLIKKIRKKKVSVKEKQKGIEIKAIEDRLMHHFGTNIKIMEKNKGGTLSIEYYSQEDLQRLIDIILK